MSTEGLHKRENSKGRASMREKLVEKHNATDEHESNFSSGRVNVRERYLHRTGIRGRKTWIFFAVLYILMIIVIVNLVILVIMLHTLQINKDGMKSLSFFDSGMLRWMRTSDLEVVTSYKGEIGAFDGKNLDIESDKDKVTIHGGEYNISAQVHIGDGDTTILAERGFRFVDPYVEKTVIHFDGNKMHLLPAQINTKKVVFGVLETHRVVTNEDQDMKLSASTSAEVRGNEGVYLDGKTISLTAKKNISISSTRKIIFDANGGVHFNAKFLPTSLDSPDGSIKRYKLCACVNTGALYRVPVVSGVTTCRTVEKMC